MKIIRDFTTCSPALKGSAVALGNFDGMHLGHQSILRACKQAAKKAGVPAAVMTFEPHPREFFNPDKPKLRIYPFKRKAEIITESGIDTLFLTRFNARFASLTAQAFVQEVLVGQLNVSHVITGYNFAFGKDRVGTTQFLEDAAKRHGFAFTACPPVHGPLGEPVSSSVIRGMLSRGEVEQASSLLGRPYGIAGRVMRGDSRGRALGYPTANIPLDGLCLPRFGIYAARLHTGSQSLDAVASLGVRPMYPAAPLLEVHALGWKGDLYGRYVHAELVTFMRDEKRFDSERELIAAIEEDCQQAQTILHRQTMKPAKVIP